MTNITICDLPMGRLGNAIFRYLSSTIFLLNYDAKRDFIININKQECFNIGDNFYIEWKNSLLYNNKKLDMFPGNYLFVGYFQHDDILKKYKNELIEHIKQNPDDLLITDGNFGNENIYSYTFSSYKSIDILTTNKKFDKYDIVFHLRLEDFITYDLVMNPNSLIKILDNYKNEKICFVLNKVNTELEEKYIDYFTKNYNIVLESNDVITDYHIMKNAKILCCSCSTLSWIAAFFSETVELVYFPNYNNPDRIHENFKKPIENTILYNFDKCTQQELISILNN